MAKEKEKQYCVVCGAELPPRRRKYCDDRCYDIAHGLSTEKIPLSTEKKPMSTKEELLSTGRDLVSMAKEAFEHHMNYGRYVEMLELKKKKEVEHGEHGNEHRSFS